MRGVHRDTPGLLGRRPQRTWRCRRHPGADRGAAGPPHPARRRADHRDAQGRRGLSARPAGGAHRRPPRGERARRPDPPDWRARTLRPSSADADRLRRPAHRDRHMSTRSDDAAQAAIGAAARELHLPTVRTEAARLAEAKCPRLKRLSEFNLDAVPSIQPATIAALATGAYMDAGEPIVLLGDSGTGKSHLLIAFGLAACEQGRRVRYVTTAQLVNELVEAADDRILSRVVGRYGRLDLLLLDELGYVQVDPRGAELLFQIITEREE